MTVPGRLRIFTSALENLELSFTRIPNNSWFEKQIAFDGLSNT